jgi:hypothetical protein
MLAVYTIGSRSQVKITGASTRSALTYRLYLVDVGSSG